MRLRIVPALSLGHHLGIHHYCSEFFPFQLGMANPDQIKWHFVVDDQINGILWNRVTHALWSEAFCGIPQLMLDDRIKWHFVELSSMIGLKIVYLIDKNIQSRTISTNCGCRYCRSVLMGHF